ncbi:hypothetical protein WICPIJ_009908 [Wickerhamomyces pijperi]|uniref:Uncharacterized protein n=1 Tax=Wickerhamomyces pijperi TaxID=599730 RepID=A0A9P8TCD5_WICPI|nr:hypothetical protein WICPIJ_009908 [Wickerhamomyces pijperi]
MFLASKSNGVEGTIVFSLTNMKLWVCVIKANNVLLIHWIPTINSSQINRFCERNDKLISTSSFLSLYSLPANPDPDTSTMVKTLSKQYANLAGSLVPSFKTQAGNQARQPELPILVSTICGFPVENSVLTLFALVETITKAF